MYGEACCTISAGPTESQVEEQLQILSGNNVEIDRLLFSLESRLSSVLRPEIPVPPCPQATEEHFVPLASAIRMEVGITNAFCAHLNSMLTRLEV